MEEDFYKGRLIEEHGIEVIVPTEEERTIIHDVIYQELCLGVIKQKSKEKYLEVIQHLRERGAEGIILGCTEITLLIEQCDVDMPIYDTTTIHAIEAVEKALE
ncbi:aspartate racemase [Bacillus sp. UNCCL13]|nr:aspartate racemase [Bacillus sp. UNCCL13]